MIWEQRDVIYITKIMKKKFSDNKHYLLVYYVKDIIATPDSMPVEGSIFITNYYP